MNPWMEDRLAARADEGLVVDIGCGNGWWLDRMALQGIGAVGVEPDPARAAAAVARSHRPVAVGDARRLPVADASASTAWCIHVLHHLSDPARALGEARRVLRPGGMLLLAETVEDHPAIRVARRIRPEWDGVAVASRFTARRCLDLVTAAGFEVVEHRQHSLVGFAMWALPVAPRKAWVATSRVEDRLSARFPTVARAARFGAHLECLARAT